MRNLKKVMALALATVMLLGIMVMGAGAADYKAYKDAASVDGKYELAIEMMKELGVFEGDNNGNLNAKNTLTRAEAAKVIATVKLGKTTASKIGAPIAAPFADVATSDWYAPFVAYCKDLGIISGVGDNKFDPAGTLTGYAFAKMLMVAAGYDAEFEGFVNNATWDTNVNLKAYQLKLLENLSINLGDAITREQAIQMAYNAMYEVEMVTFKNSGFNITTPDGFSMSSNGGEYSKSGSTLLKYLYGENTYTKGNGTDKIGLSTTTWTKTGVTAPVAETANYTVLASYTGKVSDLTYKKVYADAGLTAASVSATVYVNTVAGEGTAKTFNKDTADKVAENYDGATVKFIKNNGAYIVLIEVPTLGTVKTVTKATATTKASTELTNGLKFESEAYAEKDLVFYTLDTEGKVLTHKKADIKVGKLTEVASDEKSITLDGTKYPYAGTAILPNGFVKATSDNLKAQQNIAYVVENGYIYANASVIAAVTKASLEGVYYVDSYPTATVDVWNNSTQYVQLVSISTGEVVLEKVEAIDNTKLGTFCTLKDEDKDKLYTLEAFTGKDSDGKTRSIYAFDLVDTSIKTTTKAVTINTENSGPRKIYFNAASAILSITGTKGTVATKMMAAPADINVAAASSNVTAAKVFYTHKDGINEVALIVFKSDKALVANTVPATSAAYYLLSAQNGYVLGGKEGKEVLTKMDVIDLKTFEKVPVLVRSAQSVGFVNGTVTDGAYDFTTKSAATYKSVDKTAGVSLYNGWLTVNAIDGFVDLETANTVVLNPNSVKDADGKVITTVAQLVKSGKTTAAFDCELAQNTAKTAFTAVNYIIVK